MSDVPAYVIANFTIHDKDEYRKYEKGFFPILKKHGGSFVTFDDNSKHLEGTEPRARPHGDISIPLGSRCRRLVQRPGISSPVRAPPSRYKPGVTDHGAWLAAALENLLL